MMKLDRIQTHQQQIDTARLHVAAFASPDIAHATHAVFLTLALGIGGFVLGHVVFRPSQLSTWWGWVRVAVWMFLRVAAHIRASSVVHDCIHGSLFTHRWMNDVASILSGSLVLLDITDWKKTHCQHHAVMGMEGKEQEDPNLLVLWTTKEWAAWPRGITKLAARILRDPLVFFIICSPIWMILCNAALPQRVPQQLRKAPLVYLVARTLFVLSWLTFVISAISGGRAHYQGEMVAMVLASSYLQWFAHTTHVYDGVHIAPHSQFNRGQASLAGSACIIMPWWWRFATFGGEYHHIHHLNPRVPGYRLQECHESAPPGLWEELGVQTLTWRTGFHTLLLVMWDMEARRYVPFPEWRWLEKILLPVVHENSIRQTCSRVSRAKQQQVT